MNHAFFFQVHKEPELLRRILLRLSAPNHYFWINIDEKTKDTILFHKCLEGINNIRLISRMNVMHGGFSQVACTMMQLRHALSDSVQYDYFHTLSGQDYPCISMKKFDCFFEHNNYSYMMLDTVEQAEEWKKKKYPKRTDHYYVMDIFNRSWMHTYHLYGIIRRLFYIFPRKRFNQNLLWGGWNWFSLSKKVVEYIIDYYDNHPEFIRRFRFTTCCDELVFSSIVYPVAEDLQIVKRNSLRYVDWFPNRPYTSLPLVLDERDYDSIIRSGMFFCRKVDAEQSRKLLDMLDVYADSFI